MYDWENIMVKGNLVATNQQGDTYYFQYNNCNSIQPSKLFWCRVLKILLNLLYSGINFSHCIRDKNNRKKSDIITSIFPQIVEIILESVLRRKKEVLANLHFLNLFNNVSERFDVTVVHPNLLNWGATPEDLCQTHCLPQIISLLLLSDEFLFHIQFQLGVVNSITRYINDNQRNWFIDLYFTQLLTAIHRKFFRTKVFPMYLQAA